MSINFQTSTNTWYSTEGHECLAAEVVLGDHVVVHQGEAQHGLRQLALLTTAGAGENTHILARVYYTRALAKDHPD